LTAKTEHRASIASTSRKIRTRGREKAAQPGKTFFNPGRGGAEQQRTRSPIIQAWSLISRCVSGRLPRTWACVLRVLLLDKPPSTVEAPQMGPFGTIFRQSAVRLRLIKLGTWGGICNHRLPICALTWPDRIDDCALSRSFGWHLTLIDPRL